MNSALAITVLLLAQSGSGTGRAPNWLALIVGVVGAVLLLGGIFWIASASEKKRYTAIGQALAARGFALTLKPPKAQREELFHPFLGLKAVGAMHKHLTWCAVGSAGSATLHIAEHMYMQSHGKGAHPVYHTLAVASAPWEWPLVRLERRNILHALAKLVGVKELRLDNEAFNAAWRVTSTDADFALLLLSPEAQAWLAEAPRRESWEIGAGRIACVWSGSPKSEACTLVIDRLAQFLEFVPPELDAYASA